MIFAFLTRGGGGLRFWFAFWVICRGKIYLCLFRRSLLITGVSVASKPFPMELWKQTAIAGLDWEPGNYIRGKCFWSGKEIACKPFESTRCSVPTLFQRSPIAFSRKRGLEISRRLWGLNRINRDVVTPGCGRNKCSDGPKRNAMGLTAKKWSWRALKSYYKEKTRCRLITMWSLMSKYISLKIVGFAWRSPHKNKQTTVHKRQ